jgi:hypothetical protein
MKSGISLAVVPTELQKGFQVVPTELAVQAGIDARGV